MGFTQRTRNQRKLKNVPRLCKKINQHLAEVGEQYEEAQPQIAEACCSAMDLSVLLSDTVKSISDTL